ncbi:hypothetical protein ACFV6E_30500 [Streptomyces sp. NPDC059785]|uniref:hypothetical protein n=1 Tax=unclassified Streptomyces TaxID=2593676 RepID=UPI00364FB1E9
MSESTVSQSTVSESLKNDVPTGVPVTAPSGVPDLLTATRAEALFGSGLATGSVPTAGEIAAAIRWSIRVHGGSRGCASTLACAYGERPETAVPRMRWALGLVRATYPRASQGTAR